MQAATSLCSNLKMLEVQQSHDYLRTYVGFVRTKTTEITHHRIMKFRCAKISKMHEIRQCRDQQRTYECFLHIKTHIQKSLDATTSYCSNLKKQEIGKSHDH